MDYLYLIIFMILLYVMLSQSLTLVAGYSGLISLSQAGFYGIGAYTSAILSTKLGLPFIVNLPLAMFFSGTIAAFVALIALRTVDDYFIIITLGIQIVIFSIMNNWMSLTNGSLGITGISAISFLGYTLNSKIALLVLAFLFAFFIFFILNNIIKSPFGKILIALSEDEIFTQSLGKKVYQSKVISFIVGAILASIPGVLFAHYFRYIDPSSFNIDESIFILSIVIIGGMKKLWRVTLIAAVLVIFPELLRFIGLPDNISSNIRQIIYGLALILLMLRKKNQYKINPNA
jgi:branched-chain amino acid transport system permease protein